MDESVNLFLHNSLAFCVQIGCWIPRKKADTCNLSCAATTALISHTCQPVFHILDHILDPMIGTENGEYEEYYSVTDTGAYYLQSIEIKKYGLSNLKIKYERSLNNV